MGKDTWKGAEISRREFLQTTSSGAVGLGILAATGPLAMTAKTVAASDKVRVGLLGYGVRNFQLSNSILRIPEAEPVVVCDVYDGRFRRAAEVLGGSIETTKDYRRVLDRKDIDAVVIGTPDHWHSQMIVHAFEAGKDVYCEKPLTHAIEEGKTILDAVKRTGRIMQTGSQHLSSMHTHEAKEVIKEGLLGKVTQVKAFWDTGSRLGAWVKPIPPDASPETIDWKAWLGSAPARDFDPKRVFSWRRYSDYSSGLPGDVLSHLVTEIHWLLDLDVPTRVAAAGGIFHWDDGRDVADTITAVCQYPEGMILTIGATQANGRGGTKLTFLGTKATLELTHRDWTLYEENYPDSHRYVVQAWPKELRDAFYKEHPEPQGRQEPRVVASYAGPSGYNSTTEHLRNFFECVRTRQQPVEPAEVGHKAAVVAHLMNLSLKQECAVHWDRARQEVIS